MSSSAHANIDDLKRLQREVGKCVEEIERALATLNRSLDRADWRDQARTSFEQTLREATSQASRTAVRLNDLKPILARSIKDLQQYLGR